MVYCDEHVPCSKVFCTQLSSDSTDKTECLVLELRPGNDKVLLVVVYKPPDNDCASFLADKLEDYTTRYSNVFLIGDFNTDLLRPSRKRDLFVSTLSTFALNSVSTEPTFFHREGCSQLDLFITSCDERVLRFGQVSFSALSQHDLIFGSLDYDTAPVVRVNTYRDYVNFDAQRLENGINSIPWYDFLSVQDSDELLCFFNTHLKPAHVLYIPLRTSNSRKESNKWFTPNIAKSMLERDLAHGDWRRALPEHKDQAWERFRILRNQTTALISRTKAQYVNRFLDSRLPSKTLWKRVRHVVVVKETGPITSDFHPDEVNRVFLSNYTDSEPTRRTWDRIQPALHSFTFHPVEYWEVVNAIWEIKSNATGLDGLPIKFIKLVIPLVIHQITHMFNHFIMTSVVPTVWKHAKILPLRKKPHINTLTNLRPISILSALSKVFEKLLEKQMSSYFSENDLLSECQAGFQKGQLCYAYTMILHPSSIRRALPYSSS